MVKAEEYKGIKFVRISKLPAQEAEQISDWCRQKKITILTEEEMWRDCLQFKDYKEWYENHYHPDATANSSLIKEIKKKPAPKRNYTLGFMRYFHTLLQKN